MARRTLKEIFDQMVVKKEEVQQLSVLSDEKSMKEALTDFSVSSNSKVSVWRLWLYVMAFGAWVIEGLFEIHKTEINAIVNSRIVGTDRWLQQKALEFQDGHRLEVSDDYWVYYANEDPDSQIIERASVYTTGNRTVLKVARGDPLEALSGEELTRFRAYINDIKFVGTQINVVSNEADKIGFDMSVDYNAIIPQQDILKRINEAIERYFIEMKFDGTFYTNHLRNYIEAVEGVEDVNIYNIVITPAKGVSVEVFEKYRSVAGYIRLDEENTNIELIADV